MMRGVLARWMASPFIRFLATGGIAAAVNIGARILLSQAMAYEIAVAVAYLVGMTVAYALARLFVFADSGRRVHQEYARFAMVNAAALVQVWAVSVGLARGLFPWAGFDWHAETIAHVIGVTSPVVTSYYGHKYFTFGRGLEQ